jgi:hypothetical protein
MRTVSRLVAFVWMCFLLSLPVLGADEKDKKTDPPKEDVKKAEAKKDEPAKKDVKKDESAKKDVKKDESAKKDEPAKKQPTTGTPKMPAPKGKLKGIETDPAVAERNLMRKNSLTATVVSVVEDKKLLRLKLTIPYVKINQGQLQNYYNAQMNMMKATNAQGVYNAQQQMLQASAQIYELDKVEKEVEWKATDEVKVRTSDPPAQFDEKGRVKRYTQKELKELKGNDKLPGFPAEFSDIKAGQIVVVTLLPRKPAPRGPKRGKDSEGEPAEDNQPKISHIIIRYQPKN